MIPKHSNLQRMQERSLVGFEKILVFTYMPKFYENKTIMNTLVTSYHIQV